MYTRLIYLISFVLVLSQVGNVQAQTATWTNATGDHNWFTPGNWSEFPTDAHWAKVRNGPPGPTIANEGAVASRVHVGYDDGSALTVDGGTLVVSGDDLVVGRYDGMSATLNMISGTITVSARDFDMAREGTGTLNMTGGTINIARDLSIPENSGNTAYVNMAGGTIIISDDLDMTDTGGLMNLDGGTIIVNDDLQMDATGGTMNVTAGTLIINANALSTVQGYIDNGWITAYDANGTVYVDYDATEDKTTVYAIHDLNPNPADGGVVAPGTITLEWTVDAGTPVDVVFGTSPDWTTWEKLIDKQAVTSVSVTVVAEQRYYWAVDTYTPGTEVKIYGPIFSFLAGNAPPVVNAGDDILTWLDNDSVDVALAGTVTDTDPTTTVWTVVSEPDDPNSPDAVIADASALNTSITLSALGEYVLQLQADDGEYTGSDTMTINVYSDSCEAAKSLPDYVPLVGDVNEDCIVDARDFELIAVNWLDNNAL
jgi:hypothetical protein